MAIKLVYQCSMTSVHYRQRFSIRYLSLFACLKPCLSTQIMSLMEELEQNMNLVQRRKWPFKWRRNITISANLRKLKSLLIYSTWGASLNYLFLASVTITDVARLLHLACLPWQILPLINWWISRKIRFRCLNLQSMLSPSDLIWQP